jgi:predicted ATPase
LHPSAQCDLADLFISGLNNLSNCSLILETHSEHLILRLLRRIRETTKAKADADKRIKIADLRFFAEELHLYYFKPGPAGKSEVKEIRVDEDGEFLNTWPDGFFGEREKELF